MAQYSDLAGKTVLVTGAGRAKGLGEAIARRFAAEGCTLVITDIGHARGETMPESHIGSESALQAVAASIRADFGTDCLALPLDVLEESQVQSTVAKVVEVFGQLDVLVNNAGIGYLMKPLLEMSAGEWDAVLGVNLRGAFLCLRHAAAHMVTRGQGGRIINIASQAAKSGFPFASAYCASKHGLVGLTRVAAIEFGRHGITCNAVCPNHVTTGLGAWQNEFFAKALGLSLEDYLAAMRGRIPLGRPGLPEDTAAACAWLASAEARYVTGEAMNVSGGEEYH